MMNGEQKCCPDCLRVLIGLDTEEIDGLLYCEMCAWDKKHPKAEIIYLDEDLARDFDPKHYPIDDHMFEQFFVEDLDRRPISWLAEMRLKHYRAHVERKNNGR